ncbi:MAG: sigma-70 family RNA polymerase sigma factor [Nitrospira sp.]|nr:MAG: sigma-70 family RNA polymerase sigma factor [Nitrospira sp.]
MIISTAMCPRKKDLNEEPIEPEVLGPSDEEIAEIGLPPEASHRIAKEDPHTADSTAVVPVTALQQYLAEVRLHPYLSKEEELRLFHEYKVQGSRDAAVKLIMANLRVSISIAAEYLHTGADHMDLIQEGNVGLMHAIKKFDPSKNVRFYAYAAWWSRAYILRYLLNNYRLVKIGTTQDQRKLFYNLKKEKAKLEREGFAPDTKLLADRGLSRTATSYPPTDHQRGCSTAGHRSVRRDPPICQPPSR